MKGYTNEQRYRVAWKGDPQSVYAGEIGATESMTLAEAEAYHKSHELLLGHWYWIEQYNGWEWERV